MMKLPRIMGRKLAANSLVCLAMQLSFPAFAQDDNISVVCSGSGSKRDTQTTVITQYNRRDDDERRRRESTIANYTTQKQFSGSAYVEIYGPIGRIKLPSGILPVLRGGDDGWFEINDLSVGSREITGRVRINALNKPRMRIDRNTGIITLDGGSNSFNGQCEPYSRDADQRRF